MLHSRPACMPGREFPGLGCGGHAAEPPRRRGFELPGAAEPSLVAGTLEDRDRPVDDVGHAAHHTRHGAVHGEHLALDQQTRLCGIVEAGPEGLGFLQHVAGLVEAPGLHERRDELGHQPPAPQLGHRRQSRRPLEQIDGGREVASIQRSPGCVFQAFRRPASDRVRFRAGVLELDAVAVCLLEVVADERVELARRVARASRRSVRAARARAPSGWRRRSRRGAAGGGSGTRPRRRTPAGRAARTPCGRALSAAPSGAARRV